MKEYIALATCILPEGMLDWFNLKEVRLTENNGKTSIHIYLDENENTPDERTDLRPNGFTRESVFHDFPIRGQEVLLHVRRRRWLDTEGGNVMTACKFVQESTRCSKELAAFLKDAFGDTPITARSFEKDYFIDGDAFERAYKKTISGFKEWTEAEHAEEWLVFPENIGPYLCIDETCLSTGEVYTIVSNKDAHGKKGCIVAIIKGTKARDFIKNLKKIDSLLLAQVKEVTLDFSESMHSIVKACFPNATITLDRFHHQQFCLEAVQEVRIAFRREEMTRVANEREEFRLMLKAFGLSHSLRMIFSKRCSKEDGQKSLKKWYKEVGEYGNKAFNDIAAAMYDREDEILNYFVNRSTNAAAESLNAKIKQFRAQLRGIIDRKFFLFRLTRIYA